MNIAQIENKIQELTKSLSKETFIYDLLLAYGTPKATISKLQKGTLNLSKIGGEIAWKKKLFFKVLETEDLHETIDAIKNEPKFLKHEPRFIIVTDYETLLAIDRKTGDTLDIEKTLISSCPGLEWRKHRTKVKIQLTLKLPNEWLSFTMK